MLGRVRASSMSSLELLEMERSSPKIIKQDSLSIYESTLLKLKQGSHSSNNLEDSSKMDAYSTSTIDEAMTIDPDCTSTGSHPNCSSCSQSTTSSKEQNMSILYLFSKYKSSQLAHNANDKEAMVIEGNCSSCSSSVLHTSTS